MCNLSTLTAADPMLPCLTAKRAKSCDAMRNGVIPVRPAIAVLTAARTRHRMRLSRVRWTVKNVGIVLDGDGPVARRSVARRTVGPLRHDREEGAPKGAFAIV